MANLITKSLMGKLIAMFLLIALIPIGVVGYLSFSSSRAALEAAILTDLTSKVESGARVLQDQFEEAVNDMLFFSMTSRIRGAFRALHAQSDVKPAAGSPADAAGSDQAQKRMEAVKGLDRFFQAFLDIQGADSGYHDFLLVSNDGTVIYTHRKLSDLGTNLQSGHLRDSVLGKLWSEVVRSGKPRLTDLAEYQPAGAPSMFIGVQVKSDNQETLGVLVTRLGLENINLNMVKLAQMGQTGDAFLVGNDYTLRSASRQRGAGVLKVKVDTSSAKEAIENKKGAGEIIGLRGLPVLNAWSHLQFDESKRFSADFDWGIIVKIDSDEAFAPVRALAWKVLVVAIVLALIVAAAAYAMARNLARPVTALASQVSRISEGDLTVQVTHQERGDEIGSLAKAFEHMVQSLKDQTTRTLDGVSVLAAAALEISTTVSQLSMSTNKTSAAVTETTTTVEEVKQAAKLSSDKAKNVAMTSRQAVQISDSGRKATEDTVHRMNLIKEQMESIGETVVRLSEHSQAIEEIISAVQDLADQSNLLAVNASIEAARAGDQGKGFAVVAHEIKSLADQSKEATQQVRGILEDTRKWVSAVVMATEQGIKAVDAGVEQSAVAGSAIQALSSSVSESAQAAAVIDTTSEQQFAGVDQVAGAMASIDQAMRQNLEGTSQLGIAARKLEELGTSLKQVVERYRV